MSTQWYHALSPRHRRLFNGLVLLTLSQFLVWTRSSGGTVLMAGIGTGAPVFSGVATTTGEGVIGWRLHAIGAVILPALLYVYGTNAIVSPFWQRRGTWVTLLLMVYLARVDLSEASGWGALVGWAGVLVAARSLLVKPAVIRTRA